MCVNEVLMAEEYSKAVLAYALKYPIRVYFMRWGGKS